MTDFILIGIGPAFVVGYLTLVQLLRYRNFDRIALLPPPKSDADATLIISISQQTDFPFLVRKALEFGLFKSYSIPSISKLLVATTQLTEHTSRRYDDTDIILAHMVEDQLESPLAQLALHRLNEIHGKYMIPNEDFLYVLTIFIVEPVRWINRCGFRPLHRNEIEANHLKYMNIGIKMGIQHVPTTFEEASSYLDKYEKKYMIYHPTNVKLAESTTALFLSKLPFFLHPTARQVMHSLCPPRLRKAMGFPEPSACAYIVSNSAICFAQLTHRYLLLPRWQPKKRTEPSSKVCPFAKTSNDAVNVRLTQLYTVFDDNYPNGYTIPMLGP